MTSAERVEQSLKDKLVKAFRLTKSLDGALDELGKSDLDELLLRPASEDFSTGQLEHKDWGTAGWGTDIACPPNPEEDRRVREMRAIQPWAPRPASEDFSTGQLENKDWGTDKGIVCGPNPEEDRRIEQMRAAQLELPQPAKATEIPRPDADDVPGPGPKPISRGIDVSGSKSMADAWAKHKSRRAALDAAYKPWTKPEEEVQEDASRYKSVAELTSQSVEARLAFYMDAGN